MTKNPDPYLIDLPVYSGPLDLLLHLIERQELDITAISLATIADQYLEQIEKLKQNRLDHLMEFIVIAAKLLVIKSRALLPLTPPELSAADEEEDPAETLARQLREYKRFKSAAAWLNQREQSGYRTFLRISSLPRLDSTLDLAGITINTLADSLATVIDRSDLMEDSVAVAVRRRIVTIDDQIARLRTSIKDAGRVFFFQLLSDESTWNEVSVTLLAILELIKRYEVNVVQPELFGPIEIVAGGEPSA
jgi:segregation and condensation protein A